jgi:hypothetical protein
MFPWNRTSKYGSVHLKENPWQNVFRKSKRLLSQTELGRKLTEYPELKGKIESLLGIIESAGGDIEKAAEAERRIIVPGCVLDASFAPKSKKTVIDFFISRSAK